MAITEERLQSDADRAPASIPTVDELERSFIVETPGRPARRREIGLLWSRLLMIGWLALLVGSLIVAPAPSPNAVVPVWAELVTAAFMAGLLATAFALPAGRPWRFTASSATAGLGLVVAGACAVTEHHAGWWWAGELVAFAGLLGATRLARRAETT